MAVDVPVVIIFCLAAFGFIIVLYLCMRRMRKPPGDRQRESRFVQLLLPGEPRDTQHRVTYLLINSANAVNPDVDFPKGTPDQDRTEALNHYRKAHKEVGLTARGQKQCELARNGIYEQYLRRTICCYAADTERCLRTAERLLLGDDDPGNRKAPRAPTVVVAVSSMSPYGSNIVTAEGKEVLGPIPKAYETLLEAQSMLGATESSLQDFYEQKVDSSRSLKILMKEYTRPGLFEICQNINTDNKACLDQVKQEDEEDVIIIIGQSPFINAMALKVADAMGHTTTKKKELEEISLGDMDAIVVTRDPKTTEGLDYDDRPETAQPALDNEDESEPAPY